ncbi:MAG: hypothetical protein ACRC3Y_08850 [Romboutsia sp.]|uniref:hypothetical protein n=1 Tax=Romboutsia sp. TaxID=1965302 RepID=UPI003F3BED5B
MKSSLIEFNGINNTKEYSFKWKLEESLEGSLEFVDKKLMGSTVSKEFLNYKIINFSEDINNDGIEFFDNLIILNSRFDLSIEYCQTSNFGKLNLLNHTFYKTFFKSIDEYDYSNLDIEILIEDFYLTESENKLDYYIEVIIVINEF